MDDGSAWRTNYANDSAAVAEGSADDEVGSSLAGRRANWNLGASGVGPSLFGMSACRTVRSGLPVGYGIGEHVRTIGADALRQGSDARASLLVSDASLPRLASRSLYL